MPMSIALDIQMLRQPTETTCGQTCLYAVYRYYGDTISFAQIVEEVSQLKSGGTLAVLLANHALKRGYKATIYTYNLNVFDPTWFSNGSKKKLVQYIEAQAQVKKGAKIKTASKAYIEFLESGGNLVLKDLTPRLLRTLLNKQHPVLTGLSATYLYRSARELSNDNCDFDTIAGKPSGHFVLLAGYEDKKQIIVADPALNNPFSASLQYHVSTHRLICSILLGIITYDANLLVIEPKGHN